MNNVKDDIRIDEEFKLAVVLSPEQRRLLEVSRLGLVGKYEYPDALKWFEPDAIDGKVLCSRGFIAADKGDGYALRWVADGRQGPAGLNNLAPPIACDCSRYNYGGYQRKATEHLCVRIIPTPESPLRWIVSVASLDWLIECYTPKPVRVSDTPLSSLVQQVVFEAEEMDPLSQYPPRPLEWGRERTGDRKIDLYVIQSVNGGPVKIGKSWNPEERCEQLAIGHPYPLEVMRVYHWCGYLEKEVHDKLYAYHIRSEWYKPEALSVLDDIVLELKGTVA